MVLCHWFYPKARAFVKKIFALFLIVWCCYKQVFKVFILSWTVFLKAKTNHFPCEWPRKDFLRKKFWFQLFAKFIFLLTSHILLPFESAFSFRISIRSPGSDLPSLTWTTLSLWLALFQLKTPPEEKTMRAEIGKAQPCILTVLCTKKSSHGGWVGQGIHSNSSWTAPRWDLSIQKQVEQHVYQ